MDETVFKAYDLRGRYPDQLDEATARAVGSAFAEVAGAPRLVLARDMRLSGPALAGAFAEGVRAAGVEVLDLGLASTDLLYFASGHLDAPGAMFTASHNPPADNGVKLCLSGARPVGADTGLADVRDAARRYEESPATGDAPMTPVDLWVEWVTHVHSFIDLVELRDLKVVADVANGMGALTVPRVFEGLPPTLDVLFGELDGTFPNHPADPINPANQVDLRRRVLETGADIGLAFDGDADRVFIVDERAEPVSGSTTTAMVAAAMLERHPGATVLYNLICSKAVPEVIAERGGVAVRTRVGHSYIKQEMARTGAVFGGEHSGHYYFLDNYRADSGIIAALIVLDLLSRSSEPLSSLVAPFDRYADSGEVNTTVADPAATVARLGQRARDAGARVDELDGVTGDFGSWWFNARPSNTEPLLRLNVEAGTEAECEARLGEVRAWVEEAA